MLVSFDKLPPHARVWIYQAEGRLSPSQELFVTETAKAFCEQWVAHGAPLRTSFVMVQQQFLVLAVDEDASAPSGCSIDSSVHMLRFLQEKAGVNFLNRAQTAFLIDGEVKLIALPELKQAFKDGILGPATQTFHTLAATKREFVENWIIPAEKSWMAKFLPHATTH